MLCETVREWMDAMRGHACPESVAMADPRRFDPDDDPESEEDGKAAPRIGYVCRGCGESFAVRGSVLQADPSFEGGFKDLFAGVDGRMRLAVMMSGAPPEAPGEMAGKPRVMAFPKTPEPEGNRQARRLLQWEKMDDDGFEWRAPVPGGWLVKTMDKVVHFDGGSRRDGEDWRPSLAFVPDPGHVWGK